MSIQNKLVLRHFFGELFNHGNPTASDEIVNYFVSVSAA